MGDPREGRRTPIDLVIEQGGAPNAVRASVWLCEQLGISPESLGWRKETSSQAGAEAFSHAEAADVTKWSFLSRQQPTAPRMLVDDIPPYRGIAFIGGQSGAAKTFIACDLSLSLASMQSFFNHEVNERVGVAILSKEGTGNLANRLIAGAQARGLDLKDLPIAWRGDFPPIETPMDIQRVTKALTSLSETICGAVRPTKTAYPGVASATRQNRLEIWSVVERDCYVQPLRFAQNRKAARPRRSRTRSARPVATRASVRRTTSAGRPNAPHLKERHYRETGVEVLISATQRTPKPRCCTAVGGPIIAPMANTAMSPLGQDAKGSR